MRFTSFFLLLFILSGCGSMQVSPTGSGFTAQTSTGNTSSESGSITRIETTLVERSGVTVSAIGNSGEVGEVISPERIERIQQEINQSSGKTE